MAGWPDLVVDSDRIATEIAGRTTAVKADYAGWRDSIAASGTVNGLLAAEKYQQLAGYRNFMIDAVGTKANAVADGYKRKNPALANFDPTARWAELQVQVDAFLDWIANNWPQRTAAGWPAWQTFDPATKQLQDLVVTLSNPQRNALLARIDAIVAALPSQ